MKIGVVICGKFNLIVKAVLGIGAIIAATMALRDQTLVGSLSWGLAGLIYAILATDCTEAVYGVEECEK